MYEIHIRDLQSELDYGVSPEREAAIIEWVESKGFAVVDGRISLTHTPIQE